ncbi:MAG: NAD-dependent epimerase/dehydratase family protein [Microthrixaceae bacterium]
MTLSVLVTGGAGFIGSHVVDLLIERGHRVRVVDNLDPAAHDGPPDWLHPEAEWRWCDVTDAETWDAALDGMDAVCHQAAKVGLGVDLTDAPAYTVNNDVGTARMLAAMSGAGWRGRIVLASSMVVYGEGRYRCDTHGVVRPLPRRHDDLEAGRWDPRCPTCERTLATGLVPEDARLDPRNVYATTKLAQEHLCAAAAAELGVATTALRYHNVYGPRMPATRPMPGWPRSFARSWPTAARPGCSRTAGSAATSSTSATSPPPTWRRSNASGPTRGR